MPLPGPPIRTMADWIVFAFVTIVALIIASAIVGLLVNEFVSPEDDNSQVINVLADITTTLISAVVGYLAGKGQGRADVHQEMKEMQELELERQRQQEPEREP